MHEGVIIDQCLNGACEKISLSCHYHTWNIAKIRKYLSEDTSEILLHASISSKLDHYNSLLCGLPKHLLNRLRSIQNTTVHIVASYHFYRCGTSLISKRFLGVSTQISMFWAREN